jgi:hypothetical protein
MTTTTIDPGLRPHFTGYTAAEVEEAARRVLANYEREAGKLKAYGFPAVAAQVEVEETHIKELLKTDFFGHLQLQLDRMAQEKSMK